MSERGEMEAVIEAILFVSSEPVPRARLLELFEEEEREQAAEALAAVLARYAAGDGRGVMVEDVAGGVRLVTRPEMGVWLRRFFEVASGSKLSMAALETLAIVAYRQPITGPEIQELRSVSPVGVLKTLLEKRLVRIAGRKEVVGKPFLYATTREFLVHFGLNSLRDLPPLEEFEETFGAASATDRGAKAGGIERAAGAERTAGEEAGPWAGQGRLAEYGEEEDEDREERILREVAELDERDAELGEPAEQDEAAEGPERRQLAVHAEPEERAEQGDQVEQGEHVELPEPAATGWDPVSDDERRAASWETAVEEDLADGEAEASSEAETAAAGSRVER